MCVRHLLFTMGSWFVVLCVILFVSCYNVIPTSAQFVRLHGQMCYVETQCIDVRMTCAKRYPGDTYKSCVCNEQHYWDDSLQECLQSLNVTSVLESQKERYDNKAKIEKEADELFAGAVAAGILVIVLGLIFATGCAIYGCCEWSVNKSINYIKGNVSACLFEPEPESKKSRELDKERFTSKDPENPPERGETSMSNDTPAGTAVSNGAGWDTVVATMPVQTAVLPAL